MVMTVSEHIVLFRDGCNSVSLSIIMSCRIYISLCLELDIDYNHIQANFKISRSLSVILTQSHVVVQVKIPNLKTCSCKFYMGVGFAISYYVYQSSHFHYQRGHAGWRSFGSM